MHKTDPNYNETMASKNAHGVVGESAIWDGPLDQEGRIHGMLRNNRYANIKSSCTLQRFKCCFVCSRKTILKKNKWDYLEHKML